MSNTEGVEMSASASGIPMINLFDQYQSMEKKPGKVKKETVREHEPEEENYGFSRNALEVLKRRYLKRDRSGRPIEGVKDLFTRVARTIAAADALYDPDADIKATEHKFFRLMISRDFLPNSPTLMNAGRSLGQLSACFVLPVEDSMESIFQAIKDTALIHKSGGGTGFSFSRLRPRNSVVKSTNGVASGPVSFMKVFNAATEAVKQGGTRRGANMGILRVDHPDILEFINCKLDSKELTNFNISVAVTDDFMERVRNRKDYDLIDPRTGEKVGKLNAYEVFHKMAENAWRNGDPGIIFIDKINQFNPTPALGQIEATNPCGEQPLLPNEACNLGSINLANFVTSNGIDYDRLGNVVEEAIHFLDNVIDVNRYPLKKIEKMVKKTRKIGLGVMGFADLLFSLGIPYNSEEALGLAERLMHFIYERAREASCKLAEKRGVFPAWDKSIYQEKGLKPRNATFITIAPTGTISMIADTSSGIEPAFSLVYTKRVMDGTNFLYINPIFERVARERGFYSQTLMEKINKVGSIQGLNEIPEDVKKVFVTAHDISPEWHVRMQAAFQKWVDDAVSKTCNFPGEATVQDVMDVYWLAYQAGCKGITIYRDGSREEQVLYVGDQTAKKETASKTTPEPTHTGDSIAAEPEKRQEPVEPVTTTPKQHTYTPPLVKEELPLRPRRRPIITRGITRRIKTSEGNLYVTINEDELGLCEVFAIIGKAGGLAQSYAEAIARMISLALRSGIDPETIVKHLKGIGGPNTTWDDGRRVLSTPDAIGIVLEDYLKSRGEISDNKDIINITFADTQPPAQENKETTPPSTPTVVNPDPEFQSPERVPLILTGGTTKKTITTCPDCGATVFHESGCVTCPSCGWSKC